MKKDNDNIKHIEEAEARILNLLKQQRDNTARRFPLSFGLAASFGLVATFYGFEGLINKIAFLQNNPWLVLGVGVTILVLTGTAYRKLN